MAAVVGTAGLFVGFLEGIISWALDGLAGIAFLAGGIVCIAWHIHIIFSKLIRVSVRLSRSAFAGRTVLTLIRPGIMI